MLTVAPVTPSPGPTSTGTGSPVSREVSRADVPSTTTPSVATFSPGRTANRSPIRRLAAGMVRSTRRPPVVHQHGRLVGPEGQQAAQGVAGAAARAVLGVPAGQQERGDHGRGLEVQLGRAARRRPRAAAAPGCIRMPIAPAPPSSSAHSDQPVAAITPSETRVSIVDEPCRPARAAARWNGQADQVATGRASAATTHCQPGELQRRHHRQGDHRHGEHGRHDEPSTQVGPARLAGVGGVLVVGHRGVVRHRVAGQRHLALVVRLAGVLRGPGVTHHGGRVPGRLDRPEDRRGVHVLR